MILRVFEVCYQIFYLHSNKSPGVVGCYGATSVVRNRPSRGINVFGSYQNRSILAMKLSGKILFESSIDEIWWCPTDFCPKFPKKRPKVCPKLFFRNFSVPKSSILMYLPVRWTYIIFEMRSVGNFWNRKLVTSSVGLPTFGSILGLFRKCDFWGLFFCCRKAFDQHIFV